MIVGIVMWFYSLIGILTASLFIEVDVRASAIDEGTLTPSPRTKVVGSRKPAQTSIPHEYTHPKKAASPKDLVVGINRLQGDINYSYGYDQDKVNFETGFLQTRGMTKDWMVLVNVHTDMPLNTTNVFDAKARTLKWASPFENARENLFRVGDSHQQLALLRDWTSGKHRKSVSFIFIPPNKQVEYIIGYAAPQTATGKFESQTGGGIQMRFKGLPAGTIVLDTKLVVPKEDLGTPAALKKFSLDKLIRGAISSYNMKNPNLPIPDRIVDPKEYNYDIRDIAEVNEHHLSL